MEFEDVLRKMHMLFRLTGSRFMSNKDPMKIPTKPTTDWDFVVADGDAKLELFLSDMEKDGIVVDLLSSEAYLLTDNPEQSTVRVYGLFDRKINLIVKKPEKIASYLALFDQMRPDFYKTYLWKSGPELSKMPESLAKERICTRLEMLMDFV